MAWWSKLLWDLGKSVMKDEAERTALGTEEQIEAKASKNPGAREFSREVSRVLLFDDIIHSVPERYLYRQFIQIDIKAQ